MKVFPFSTMAAPAIGMCDRNRRNHGRGADSRIDLDAALKDLPAILNTTEQTLRLWEKHRKKLFRVPQIDCFASSILSTRPANRLFGDWSNDLPSSTKGNARRGVSKRVRGVGKFTKRPRRSPLKQLRDKAPDRD
jgi:hypothetical protein